MTASSTIAGTANSQVAPERELSQAAIGFALDKRGISQKTLDLLGAVSGTAFFPTLNAKSEAIFFPTRESGDVVNWKAVAFPSKAFIGMKGGKLQFFNLDAVLKAAPEEIYITEGEFDACALVEAGIPPDRVLSVPNGAREDKAAEDDSDLPKGYDYAVEALEKGLNRVKRVVWCGDMDGPGRALRHQMAKIFGAARFHFVDWPEGSKDANDFLRSDGPDAVLDLVVNGALEWPVSGLFRMSELPEPPPLTLWHPGFSEWGNKIRLAPGTMSVVTGHPGHGKTAMWTQIWFQVVNMYGLVACIASFETRPKPHVRRTLRTLKSGKLEKDMSDDEKARADKWIEERYLWLQHEDQKPNLKWLLDKAEVAVVRHGARILQIDPWNRLEGGRGRDETETEYIGRCLTEMYVFAQQMNCHVQVMAHPAKLDGPRKGKPPELEDISGSKHWDNRIDQGFVVHRPKMFNEDGERSFESELYHKKSRFEELGFPTRLKMRFEPHKGRFLSADYEA
ncbi:DnaB-like helicase C-terminal domain-containing protein [Chelatococcus sp.]|uniref:DnaB-like helicase C-terminal domain-containing protein n=1 Tax=Chelatococcus sp. TaxID=1953771 RepID=UPI001ED5750E|nr:DnaB-like helicase C-terminal domain-containing protein [Chelatococcus sp.]MBX3546883.1 AAA family ATPase [Chelatococcus sp.]